MSADQGLSADVVTLFEPICTRLSEPLTPLFCPRLHPKTGLNLDRRARRDPADRLLYLHRQAGGLVQFVRRKLIVYEQDFSAPVMLPFVTAFAECYQVLRCIIAQLAAML